MTDISVIIVSYNCCSVLQLSLDAVRNASEGLDVDVYVVDNNSTDGTIDILTRKYKWINLIRNNVNVGFSRANNIAMVRCKGQIVLLLNPDALIPRGFLHSLVSYYKANPKSGAVGVQMTDGRGRFLKESKRGYTSVSNSLFKLTGLWRLAPHSARFNGYYLGHEDRNKVCVAPILSGACMAFPHAMMDKVGLFDDAYFMYSEDIDLSWRMYTASEQNNYYLGNLNIVHFKGQCTPRKVRYVYYFYAGMTIFAKKYEFKYHNFFFNQFILFGICMAFLLSVLKLLVGNIWRFLKPKKKERRYLYVEKAEDIPADASHYCDTILFRIDSDIEQCISYMQEHKKQFYFGFYNKEKVFYIPDWGG